MSKVGMWAQGWENYQKEFKQLRRSFRYNEYGDIRKLNPPTTFVGRVSTAYVIVCSFCTREAHASCLLKSHKLVCHTSTSSACVR